MKKTHHFGVLYLYPQGYAMADVLKSTAQYFKTDWLTPAHYQQIKTNYGNTIELEKDESNHLIVKEICWLTKRA